MAEWPSALACRGFRSGVAGASPSLGFDHDNHFVRSLANVLNIRLPQSVPTMSTSLRWNHLSDHPLVQWGITRGVPQETSLPRKEPLKKIRLSKIS